MVITLKIKCYRTECKARVYIKDTGETSEVNALILTNSELKQDKLVKLMHNKFDEETQTIIDSSCQFEKFVKTSYNSLNELLWQLSRLDPEYEYIA